MKIERLTENKIRIIINSSDFNLDSLDAKTIMANAVERSGFFTYILEKAKDEVGFNTDGCRLLIEAFSTSDDVLVFTITKYLVETASNKILSPSKISLKVKRKSLNINCKHALYKINSFDEFCDFCECLDKEYRFDIKKLSKNTYLYLYNNTYYLLMKNTNLDDNALKNFYSISSEFLSAVHYSSSFESKLLEHGKLIIKGNAILTGVKFFSKKRVS